MSDQPYDEGLQPERTLLAWRRTCLAVGVANAVGARLLVGDLGAAAVLIGLVGITLAVTAWLLATRRYRRAHHSLVLSDKLAGSGGTAIAITTAAALTFGALGLILTCLLWWPWS